MPKIPASGFREWTSRSCPLASSPKVTSFSGNLDRRPRRRPTTWRGVSSRAPIRLNMHLRPSGKPEEVRPSIGLYFTDKAPTRFPMLLQLEHDGALDIPPGETSFTVTDQLELPVDVTLLAVYPHAHYLGREVQGTARLPDGTTRWLVHITDWDLNWQAVYHLQEPMFLPKETVVWMEWTYDNSSANVRNPHSPPERVRNGDRASDEMGRLWLRVLPSRQEDGLLLPGER